MFGWLKTLLILPFNVVVIIPSLILYFSGYHYKRPDMAFGIVGSLLLATGLFLSIWTMILFAKVGKGTLAPWNPPKNLIVKGPYCFVRNPMIIGVLLILISECFFFSAIQLVWWAFLFFIINNIYFYVFEERQLENNFGEEYKNYKKNVPMWIPRFSTWKLK